MILVLEGLTNLLICVVFTRCLKDQLFSNLVGGNPWYVLTNQALFLHAEQANAKVFYV